MDPDLKCDKCGKGLTVDEVGYLGPADPANAECNPFVSFICLCLACAKADPRYHPEKK